MKLSFQSALGAFFVLALSLGSLPALAQSAFPTPGGSYVDGHALMCPNGSIDFQGRPIMVACGGASNPIDVNATVSASISGFTPTPSYSTGTTSASDQTVALPTGTEFILTNNGANPMAWNIGAAATGSMNVLQPNSWIAFAGTGGAAFHYIEATGAGGTSAFSISGGSGLPTGAGGGSSGGSGGSVTIANPVDSINGGVETTSAANSTTVSSTPITTADVGQTCTSTNWGAQTACTGTPTTGSAYQVAVHSAGYIWIQNVTTGGTGTFNFQIRISNDNGVTWFNRGIFQLTNTSPFQVNGIVSPNFAGYITGGVTNVEVDAVTYTVLTGSPSTTVTITQGQATPFVTSSATSSSINGGAATAATNIQGNGTTGLPVNTNQQQLANVALAAPTATGVAPAGGAIVPNVNAAITGGTVTATFSQFAPNGNYATLTVGASSARVALPSGLTVAVYNTGSNAAFVQLGSGSVVATATNDQVAPGGFLCFAVGSNVDLAAIETAGATTLNISGGAGGCAGSGGGGGSSASGNVFQANLFSITGNSGTPATTQIVAASGSLTVYLVNYSFQGQATTGTFQLVSGTSTNCSASQTPLTPLWDMSTNPTGGEGPIGVLAASAPGAEVCAKTTGSGNNITWRAGFAQQ